MNRQQFATRLKECHKSIKYVNPSDKEFWRHTYILWLDTGCFVAAGFLVHASSLSDAHDAVADYCKKKGYMGYFADPDYIEELRMDAKNDGREDEDAYVEERYCSAGNEGDYFCNILTVDELTEGED